VSSTVSYSLGWRGTIAIMSDIRNFDEARAELAKYMPPPGKLHWAYTLERIQALMKYLGNPQDKFKVIHVAGTSGKTSTCYYLSSLLQQAGQKVGLTVSPHVDEINERVQINLIPLPEADFCKYLNEFLDIAKQSEIKLTYFELLVALAFWVFARQKVDYAVVEVGLGGLLDGTNVISNPDKICVITDIGLDHTDILGETPAEITAQKAGIIQPKNTVFVYRQDDAVMNAIRKVAKQKNANLHEVIQPDSSLLPSNLPPFQRHNWYLAKQTVDWVLKRDGNKPLAGQQHEASTKIIIPARMEVVKSGDKTLIIDGSHNAQKITALMEGICQQFSGQPVAALISFMDSKQSQIKLALEQLLPIVDSLIITSFSGEQDTLKNSIDQNIIAKVCRELKYEKFNIINNPEEAFAELMHRPQPVLLVTGSFYLLNHIRPIVFQAGVTK